MSLNSAPQQQTSPTTNFELEQVSAYGKYILSGSLDILFILRSLIKRASTVTVYLSHGKSFFLTSLLAIGEDEKTLILDMSGDPAANRAAEKTTDIVATAHLDNVKIQFALGSLHGTSYEGSPAFAAAVPQKLLRLQRREYFRLEVPVASPLHCQIPIAGEGESHTTLDVALFDISGGGLSLIVPGDAAHFFNPGALYRNCRLLIPEEGVVVASLCVRSCFHIKRRDGHEHLRAGCEFINLPGAQLNAIQRYITRVERQRKARLAGLD